MLTVEVAPVNSRPGRPFEPKAEAHLASVLRVAGQRIRTSSYDLNVLLSEAVLPTGVADLVVMRCRASDLAARLNADIPTLLTPGELAVIASCTASKHGATLNRIVLDCGQQPGVVRRRVRQLHAAGALSAVGHKWQAHPAYDLRCRTYALEAKVSDWRAGVWQALRYRTWCDGSALVLGELSPRLEAAAKAAAQDVRVGLYANDRWLVRPRLEPQSRATRLAVSERLVSAMHGASITQAQTYQMLSASA
jgi:hypothetical protein